MKKSEMPQPGEIVICRITSVNPNSVFARIQEYDKEGMIHVSEVASRWVRDIREFVRENQFVVCKVLKIEGNHISLSLKRVSREESASRLNEFKRERKSEKLLELAAKQMGVTLEKAYEESGNELVEKFGSLTKAFDVAAKNPDMLLKHGTKKNWADVLVEIVKKSRVEKKYEVKALLELTCYKPDGVSVIKNILSKLPEGFDVKYISAPKYLLVRRGGNRKLMESELSAAAASLIESLEKSDGQGSFKIMSD